MSTQTWRGWRPPYGYAIKNKNLVIMPAEAKIVKHVFSLALKGQSKRDILYYLNKHKILSKSGKEWSSGTLSYLFKEDKIMFYAGYIKGEKAGFEPIIDLKTAKLLIKKFVGEKISRPHTKEYLLSNIDILRCGYCDGKAKSSAIPSGNKIVDYYLCSNRQMYGAQSDKCVGSKTIPQNKVNEKILTDLSIQLFNKDLENNLEVYRKRIKKIVDLQAKTVDTGIAELLDKQYSIKDRKELGGLAKTMKLLLNKRQAIVSPVAKIADLKEIKSAKRIKFLTLSEQKEIIKKLIYRINLFADKVIVEYNFGIKSDGTNTKELELD